MDAMAEWKSEPWAAGAEARVLTQALILAEGRPWNDALVRTAAAAAGMTAADAGLLLPNGARDLTALLFQRHDRQALSNLEGLDPSSLKVRERIFEGVSARMRAAMADEAAVRAAARFLARPDNVALALRLGWASADGLWRWAGDRATDENHYSKRAILEAVLASTMAVRLTRGEEAARSHLKARIDQVMAFETWKAKRGTVQDPLAEAAGALGRLRYGRRIRSSA